MESRVARQRAGAEVYGIAGHRVDHILYGQVVFVGAVRIHDYGNPLGHAAFNRYVVNAADRFQSRDDLVVGDASQGGNILLAADAQQHHRENVRGEPQNVGLARIVGQNQPAGPAPDFLFCVPPRRSRG